MFLDDLIKSRALGGQKSLKYNDLPTKLYLSEGLTGLLQAMEAEANAGANPTQREAGTLIGFTSNDSPLGSLPTVLSSGGAFDPKVFLTHGNTNFGRVAMGFQYQGTAHTHPRRPADDPLQSFSGADVVSFAEKTFQERVSVMVSDKMVHVLVDCDEDVVIDLVPFVGRMVTQSATEARGMAVVVAPEDLAPLTLSPQSIAAVMKAATAMRVGYYFGLLNDALHKMS